MTRSFRVNVPGNIQKKAPRRTGKKDEKHSDKKYNDKQAGKYDHRKSDDHYSRGKDKYDDRKHGRRCEDNPEFRLPRLENEYPDSPSVEGTFIGHPKGFGFVEIEGEDNDVFISGRLYRNGYAPG